MRSTGPARGSADPNPGADVGSRGWSLLGTFQKMSDWGDEFERKHFNGDFKGALARGPRDTFNRMSDWGDEFERRHFDGDFVGAMTTTVSKVVTTVESFDEAAANIIDSVVLDLPPDPPDALHAGIDSLGGGGSSSSSGSANLLCQAASRSASHTEANPWVQMRSMTPASMSMDERGLWEESQRLKEDLAAERERRKGRTAALDAFDKTLRSLREEIQSERQEVLSLGTREQSAKEECDGCLQELKQLQEINHLLKGRAVHQEAEVRRLEAVAAAEAAAAARAHRECEEEGPRAWARPGNETDALKEAKVELAIVLTELDEQRLERRRELKELQSQLEAAEAENLFLKRGPDYYVAPDNSFRASISRLFNVARGRPDDFAHLERARVP